MDIITYLLLKGKVNAAIAVAEAYSDANLDVAKTYTDTVCGALVIEGGFFLTDKDDNNKQYKIELYVENEHFGAKFSEIPE